MELRLATYSVHRNDVEPDFRVKTTLWIATAGFVVLAPFCLAALITGQLLLALGSGAIVGTLAGIGYMAYKGYHSDFSLILVPPLVSVLALAVHEQGIAGVMWAYPSIIGFYFILREKWAWVANALTICTVVPVAAAALEQALALRAIVTLALVSGFSIISVRVISRQQVRLERMATTDPLTGLLNRSTLISRLDLATARHRRSEEPATLLAIDIDHFKLINDTYGHLEGDEVLRGVAEILVARLRATDTIFRTGGEEFTVVLSDTGLEPACHVAQLVRSAIAGANLIDTHRVTVSIGVAPLTAEATAETWMAQADRCLYTAKNDGRNRVVAEPMLMPTSKRSAPRFKSERRALPLPRLSERTLS